MGKLISNLDHVKAIQDFDIAAKTHETKRRYLSDYNETRKYNRLVCK